MFQRKLIQLIKRSPSSILSRNLGGETTASAGWGQTDIAVYKVIRVILLRISWQGRTGSET